MSDISPDLIANYYTTHYQVGTDSDRIILRIDQHSEPLSQLFIATNTACAAFISAYNPFSQLRSTEDNLIAHTQLHQLLFQHPKQIIEGMGIDPSGTWPAEKSWLVLGLDLDTAQTIAQQFNQNAIVWSNINAIPKLILLR
ncbi:Protein of unknown function [Nitrosomonas cryotolerans]|uniref:DUF3293 domain-containing protein n=1 Tax=Nitrosomonas cryotolerans ATCC 49181 TaxID=1131553 RepID=A0A1N6H2N9_9PROT|nr:DUF3293 domain-containing protein [Nitrosomonas cryotolerans]SFP72604.1 Protein of unknown function [Nitrosomonas cryotolerans]SIO14063.1 Protein of unknown function [Nitrosomonas cryotolerans ATCC 49181]